MNEENEAEGAQGARSQRKRKPQCRWAIANGSDGFLLCARDEGHDESLEAHCTIYEHPEFGACPAPAPGEDRREWFPGWLWRSVVEQDRERPRRGYLEAR